MSIRIREPKIFHGTPDADGQERLSRFEILADANKWDTNKVNYVNLYLVGTARQWVLVRDPRTWEDFKRQFLDAKTKFKDSNKKFKIQINDEAAIKTSGPCRIRRVIYLYVGTL